MMATSQYYAAAQPIDETLRKALKAAGIAGIPVPPPRYDIPRLYSSLDDIPGKFYRQLSVKIFVVGALVWDYTETILDMAEQMKIDNGIRRVSRAIHEVKRDYDAMCERHLDFIHLKKIKRLSLDFEDYIQPLLSTLNSELLNEIHAQDSELNKDYMMLLNAVYTALTVLNALHLFALESDDKIARFCRYAPHSCLSDHFSRLEVLIPQYAGDHYNPNSKARRAIAKELLNEINNIEVHDDPNEPTD